ncbi:n-acetylglutamate synthase [Catalinimonas niigatensis]|uniref:n-acetylglutamate synthase n=1 Tax=Catalinimonas niigatensis TaxID=1397264 RepID=UPI002666FEDC|nr:n-acetylglutamate synthase [Catalinimonas niigatensis]WPP48649.1 n-acetylglutamate synthase [Catalinimonas niigatensis]
MQYNLHQKRFRSLSNSSSGDVDKETVFYYFQEGDIVWATYRGGAIRKGTLIARWLPEGQLEMRYQHLSKANEFKTGQCVSTPELQADGKLRMYEKWKWTSGDKSEGNSIIEEI